MAMKPAQLSVRVQPRARRNELAGWREGDLVVKVTAPPVEGAANKAAIKLLAKELGVRPANLSLVRGARSRRKVIAIEWLTEEEVRRRLG